MAKIMFILLISAIAMDLFPTAHTMSSMRLTYMDETVVSYQGKMGHGSMKDNSMGSCCDEIAPFSMGCGFLMPQYACVGFSGESNRVLNSRPLAQSIYIETSTPPPKA